MTVLGISSSPRQNGNSEQLLSAFLQGAAAAGNETELVRLNSLRISPCQACDSCAASAKCILKDDMQSLYPKVASCSGLVLATPIYFGTLSGQLKIFMDRFQSWWFATYRLQKPFIPREEKRPGFFICTGALKKKEYCENAEKAVDVLFHVINIHKTGSLSFRGYDEKGSVAQNKENLDKAYQAGYNFLIEKE